jgi:hypothetical protein
MINTAKITVITTIKTISPYFLGFSLSMKSFLLVGAVNPIASMPEDQYSRLFVLRSQQPYFFYPTY